MELEKAALVRLPAHLSPSSVDTLMIDMYAAFSSPAAVVVFVGAEPGTFCSGLDLASEDDDERFDVRGFSSVLASLLDSPKPTLAFVDGRALGGGLGIAAACDWVTATDRSSFGLPELLWGVIPAMIWPIIVTRMTEGVARRWTLSADTRDAPEALAAGLVDELVLVDEGTAALTRTVAMLERAEPMAVRTLRHWMYETRDSSIDTALARGAAVTAQMAGDPVTRARIAAFDRGESPWG
jgi:enoyl-CoA hydratase/carnithine racemase